MRSVRLSEKEQRLLDLIPADGTAVDTGTLLAQYYGEEGPPLNGRTIVVGRLRGIAAKLDRMKHKHQLLKSDRAGPHPVKVWLRPRPQ